MLLYHLPLPVPQLLLLYYSDSRVDGEPSPKREEMMIDYTITIAITIFQLTNMIIMINRCHLCTNLPTLFSIFHGFL